MNRIEKPDANYRNPQLLKLASKAPHCMRKACGAPNRGQVVACHSNSQEHGKGTSLKAHDIPAYLCDECHALLDGRTPGWDAMQKALVFAGALFESWLWLMRSGHLKVDVKGMANVA